jgi:hypothetical protein
VAWAVCSEDDTGFGAVESERPELAFVGWAAESAVAFAGSAETAEMVEADRTEAAEVAPTIRKFEVPNRA